MDRFIGTRRLILQLVLVAPTICWPAPITDDLDTGIDTQIAATVSGNSSSISGPAPQTNDLSRKVNTTLAFLILLLVASTYWILTTYTHNLSNHVWLPSVFLQPNIDAILSKTWPKTYGQPPGEFLSQHWLLFFPKRIKTNAFTGPYPEFGLQSELDKLHELDPDHSSIYHIEGHNISGPSSQLGDQPDDIQSNNTSTKSPQRNGVPIKFRTPSPIMKTLVQMSVWNSVSSWLVFVMIANTLVYNGFLNKRPTNDSIIRLILVLIYGIANLVFLSRTSSLLYRNFTFALFQACWKLVLSTFVPISLDHYQRLCDTASKTFPPQFVGYTFVAPKVLDKVLHGQEWNTLDLEVFGKAKPSTSYCMPEAAMAIEERDMRMLSSFIPKEGKWSMLYRIQTRQDRELFKFLDTLRDAEIKAYEKSTESALEKMLANIAILLGICLATGLASWTSAVNNDSTSSQLGSYALLLSISTGLLALISVHSQLTNATESASTLLLLHEKTIDAVTVGEDESVMHTFSLEDMPSFGFSEGIASEGILQKQYLNARGLWRLASFKQWLPFILFGPALLLIPWHLGNHSRDGAENETDTMTLEINGVRFKFRQNDTADNRLVRCDLQATEEKGSSTK